MKKSVRRVELGGSLFLFFIYFFLLMFFFFFPAILIVCRRFSGWTGSAGFLCVSHSTEKSSYINKRKQWVRLERNKAPNTAETKHVMVPVLPSLPLSLSLRSDDTIHLNSSILLYASCTSYS